MDLFNNPDVKSLGGAYIVPPFSILDTTSKEWKARKTLWKKCTGDLTASKENVLYSTDKLQNSKNPLQKTMGAMESSSNFDPVLAEIMLHWFCPIGGKVLDPFGGEQTKGVVCGEKGHEYHGCEIREEQVLINIEKTKKYKNIHYYKGDSTKIFQIIQERNFDMCFTSPPYYNLEVYSKEDLSALGSYDDFMHRYFLIFRQCFKMLQEGSFLVLKVGEIRDKIGFYYNFIGGNIRCMLDIGFQYYNEIILVNSIGSLPFRTKGMSINRKIGKRHQNILVFYKGDVKLIKEKFHEL